MQVQSRVIMQNRGVMGQCSGYYGGATAAKVRLKSTVSLILLHIFNHFLGTEGAGVWVVHSFRWTRITGPIATVPGPFLVGC